jgi:hypothetical protein
MPQKVISGASREEEAAVVFPDVLLQASQYALRSTLNTPHVRLTLEEGGESDVVHLFTKGESMVRLQSERQVQPDSVE